MNTQDYKSFAYLESGEILFSQYSTIKSTSTLDPGSYRLDCVMGPRHECKPVLSKDLDFEAPKAHNFANKEQLDKLFESFFNKRLLDKVRQLGFCHKVGVLLYGKEGTGKSTILKQYYTSAIKNNDAVVFHMVASGEHEVSACWKFIQNIRKIQDNPIIIVFDEFDRHVSSDQEGFLKTAIDGNMSIDNCVFLASTNYIDRIPSAMKDRPSRFKYSINIEGLQSKADVISILRPLLSEDLTEEELDKIASDLKGSTLDELKQYALDTIMDISHKEIKRRSIGFQA